MKAYCGLDPAFSRLGCGSSRDGYVFLVAVVTDGANHHTRHHTWCPEHSRGVYPAEEPHIVDGVIPDDCQTFRNSKLKLDGSYVNITLFR